MKVLHQSKKERKQRVNNPFLEILPKIDVHGYTRDTVYLPVSDFINDNLKLNNKKIVVIHGIGNGILKDEIFLLFRKDKRVKSMHIDFANLGCIIIELN